MIIAEHVFPDEKHAKACDVRARFFKKKVFLDVDHFRIRWRVSTQRRLKPRPYSQLKPIRFGAGMETFLAVR
jgi:hypothetical protein